MQSNFFAGFSQLQPIRTYQSIKHPNNFFWYFYRLWTLNTGNLFRQIILYDLRFDGHSIRFNNVPEHWWEDEHVRRIRSSFL